MQAKKKKQNKTATCKNLSETLTMQEIKMNANKNSLFPERLVQGGGVEGRALTPSYKNTRITTNC